MSGRMFATLFRVVGAQRPISALDGEALVAVPGVAPAGTCQPTTLQDRGIGSQLMTEYCRRLDAVGEVSYLETDKCENVPATNAADTR
jgi:hypothetical protein